MYYDSSKAEADWAISPGVRSVERFARAIAWFTRQRLSSERTKEYSWQFEFEQAAVVGGYLIKQKLARTRSFPLC